MAFIAGAGATNVDLLYQGMERIPDVGEELYCKAVTKVGVLSAYNSEQELLNYFEKYKSFIE